MDDRRRRRANEILDAALELDPSGRMRLLEEECGADAELRAMVERLLRHAKSSPGFLAPGGTEVRALAGELAEADAGSDPYEGAAAGRVVGVWRIEREIGRGGMAVVYLATRADGQFDQKVALKLVHGSLRQEEAVRRFERERQILAGAVHPGIARLFDGGVTPEGEPWFAMEHVEGKPIDAWCNERRLDVPGRLQIFLRVAGAVAYAHRNLIVHRDIKPANILVTDGGDVKLLDFGIAKPLGEMGAMTELTRVGSSPMTPSFASPEQVRGDPVTTAVDIWQLGVLLYLLLSGRMPHAASSGDLAALQRSILEETPQRPSALLPAVDRREVGGAAGGRGLPDGGAGGRGSGMRSAGVEGSVEDAAGGDGSFADRVARARATTPAQLRRALSGDLDNIILKALRKEPERRYASVAQLIEDIESHLAGRTVSARPDTLGYRTSKFVRRHRVAVALGMAALWLLVAFALTMTVQAGRIARERDRANREREAARQVASLMVDIFRISDPGESRGNSITAREILDRGAQRVEEGLAGQPEIRSELQDTLGRVYQNLGLYDSALPLLEQALVTRRERLGPRHPDTVVSMKNLAWLLEQKGDYASAEPLHREVLEATREIHGIEHLSVAGAINNLALMLHRKGDSRQAEGLFREAIAMYEAAGEADSEGMADAKSNLGLALQRLGRLDEAEALYSDSLEMRRRLLGADHPSVAVSLDNLGRVEFDRGRMDEAERRMREALDLRLRVLGGDHPEVATSLSNLGSVLFRKGDLAGAEEIFVRIVEFDREKLGESHPDYGNSLNNLAHIRMKKGDPGAAAPSFLQALAVYERSLPEGHWLTALARSNYGECLAKLRRFEEAEREMKAGHEGLRKALGEDNERTLNAATRLADLYDAWGRPSDAARIRPASP